MPLREKIITTVKKSHHAVIAIYLFGSANTQYETIESDIDIAILLKHKMTLDERLQLTNDLIDSLHKDKIDLIDLKQAPTVLKFQIMMNGRRIYYHDLFLADSFEMYTFSDYVRLNEERHEILDAVQKRGTVL